MVDQAEILDVIERLRNRFYGKYRGSVTKVDSDTLRVKAKVPAVLGDVESGWCRLCVPYAGSKVGIAFIPEEGTGVWVEFEGGDVSYPIVSGCYWRDGEIPSDAAPDIKAIVTVAGNKIILNDKAGSITISDSNGNKITLDSSGVAIERGSNKVEISDSEVNVNDGALEVM